MTSHAVGPWASVGQAHRWKQRRAQWLCPSRGGDPHLVHLEERVQALAHGGLAGAQQLRGGRPARGGRRPEHDVEHQALGAAAGPRHAHGGGLRHVRHARHHRGLQLHRAHLRLN